MALSDFIDRAEPEHERVVVTRNGPPAAVLIGYEDLAALEETLKSSATPKPWQASSKHAKRSLTAR